ncbi:MAG: domain S-box [Phycisphaerales bacterium]|nr:domain S-box [Phycisphaerales bacterium]
MRKPKHSNKPSRPARPPPAGRKRGDTTLQLKRVIHELEVYQEEIRIQNQQLIESQRLLEESRDRYADLYDLAPVAYVTLCPNGVIQEINRGGAELLGAPRSRALESPMILFVEPGSRRMFLAHMHRCRTGIAPVVSELALLTRDGRHVDVQLASGAGFEHAPAVWRYPTTVFDLTERKRAEEESRRLLAISSSERMLRSVLSALPVGVRVIDAAGNVQLQNQASRQIFGSNVGPPAMKWEETGILSAATGEPLPRAAFPAVRALEHGDSVMREEVILPAAGAAGAGGQAKMLQLSAVPLRDEDGRIVGTVSVSHDVTELKVAEAHLRDAKESAETANRVKDNFLAVVSHELRTPLTAILLWARMLREENLDPPTSAKAAESIEQSAQSQLRLVDDLLDVSRIVAGKLRLVPRPTRVSDVVEAALASARPAAEEKRIRLIERLGRGDWVGQLDGDRMRQVVGNLLSNAIKFTPPGGWVRVGMSRRDGRARIEVTDNGRGIAADFLPHVFDPFRQGDGATTRLNGGLGLGLSIARQLVELHGGSISAQSAGEGRGATFFVELPVQRDRAAAASQASRQRAAKAEGMGLMLLADVRVLLVEDDAKTRAAVQLILKACGADVAAASSAQEGRELFNQHRPQVLVTDIAMPEESGYELLQSVRKLERASGAPAVPAVALTAFASDEDRRRTTQAGFAAHVAKPFEPALFIRLLRRLARKTRPTVKRKEKSKGSKP